MPFSKVVRQFSTKSICITYGANPPDAGEVKYNRIVAYQVSSALFSLDESPHAEVWGSPHQFAIRCLLELYPLKALRAVGTHMKAGVRLRPPTQDLVELETKEKSKKLAAKVVEDLSDEVLTL